MKKISQLFTTALTTVKNFPLVLLSAFLAVIFAILSIEKEGEETEYPKLLMTFGVGIGVFFAVRMAEERFGKALFFRFFGGLVLLFFYFVLLREPLDTLFNLIYFIDVIVFVLMVHLAVSFVPFVFTQNKEFNFWEYNKSLFMNFIISKIFVGVLTIGILLAISAVSELFDVYINEKVYGYFSISAMIFMGCFIFLSFCKNLQNLESETSEYPLVLKFFTQFVLVPLLIIYGGILYLYGTKILVTWTLPQGWISFMIMAFSLVGLLAYLLVYPLAKMHAKSWVKFFSKAFNFMLLPLMVLLFVAINTRILAYGITENRYFVLLFAIWLSVVVFYFLIFRKTSIRFIPVSLFVFALLSIAMPYFNVHETSIRSQKSELIKALEAANIYKNGIIDFKQLITNKEREDIIDKMYFLSQRGEKEFLLSLASEADKRSLAEVINDKSLLWSDFMELFPNTEDSTIGDGSNYLSKYFLSEINVPQGYPKMISLGYFHEEYMSGKDKIVLSQEGVLKLTIEGNKFSYSLTDVIIEYLKTHKHTEDLNPPHFAFSVESYEFVLVPSEIQYTEKDGEYEDIEIGYKSFLFYRKKE